MMDASDRHAIEALIPADAPTRPRAFAVLDGVLAGQILTDRPGEPGWVLVVETAARALQACVGDVLGVREVVIEATNECPGEILVEEQLQAVAARSRICSAA